MQAANTRIVAILAVGNDFVYLRNCLRHLLSHDVEFAIIDDSEDQYVRDITTEEEFSESLVRYKKTESSGLFSLERQLHAKEIFAREIDADWIIHLDVDEIMHPASDHETLAQAIKRLDNEGFSAVNFNEFVFLPLNKEYDADIPIPRRDFIQAWRHYYFFEPKPQRLMRAWKKSSGLSNVESGGHVLNGKDLRLAPESFVLRHYPFTCQEHAFRKYVERKFPDNEIARGWHGNRVGFPSSAFCFPNEELLERLDDVSSRDLGCGTPKSKHYWQWS